MPLRAKVNGKSAWPSLVPLRRRGGLRPIVLSDACVVVGSGARAQIRLRSPSVSGAHVLMLVAPGRAYVRDLASEARVYVNDEAVRGAHLRTGDVVRIGRFSFCVRDAGTGAAGEADAPPPPVIDLRVGGRPRRFAGPVVVIGSRVGCDVRLPAGAVSEVHAALISTGEVWQVLDLGSAAGTFVNSVEVAHPTELREGDAVRIGTTDVCVVAPSPAPAAEAPRCEAAVGAEPAGGDDEGAGSDLARVWSFEELTRRVRERPERRGSARDAVWRRLLWLGVGGAVVCGAVAGVLHGRYL
jgi:pSer/pThr/pTyr-binding forkhead associated (FHA) protein